MYLKKKILKMAFMFTLISSLILFLFPSIVFATETVPSTYSFSYNVPSVISVCKEVEVPVTFATNIIGAVGYNNVRFRFSAAGPGNVNFTATDSNNNVIIQTNNGVWGPASGFNLPAGYTATTDWKLKFSEAGNYTITFSLINAPDGSVIEGITNQVFVYVSKPGMNVWPGKVGESTNFGLWAPGCNGLAWGLVVNNGTVDILSLGGQILDDNWNNSYHYILPAGDYTATFSVGGAVQEVDAFSIWGYDSSMDVSVGYAGETTTFTLNATNSSGKTADFELSKGTGPDNSEMIYNENNIPIGNDDWSYSIPRTLTTGRYWAGYWLDNFANWGGGYDFYVVNRGVPQPAAVAIAAPVKESGPSGPAVNEKPISDYDKTNSGFATLFYNRLLRRAPEKAGLDAWVAGLTGGALTGADLINGFVFGVECQKTISGYTNTEFITFLYKALFNRKPDTDGLNAWLTRMSSGMTKEEVVNGFTHSLEFELICKNFGIMPYKGYIISTK